MRAVIPAASGAGLGIALHLYCAGGSATGLSATDAYGAGLAGDGAQRARALLVPRLVSGLISNLVGEVPAMSAIRLNGRLFRPVGLCGSFRPAARRVDAIGLQLAGVLLLRKVVLQVIGSA
jgi:hypothetical protein